MLNLNQEQLARLQQGVEEWNGWRQENPGIKIELSVAVLSVADLSRANLSGANHSGAYLSEVDLCGDKRSGTKLISAYHRDALNSDV